MKILFIGNRFHVIKELLKDSEHEISIYVLQGSLLEEELLKMNISFYFFDISSKKMILEIIEQGQYEILISNGCPFIIPINDRIKDKILINIHPTYLPELRGKTPLNGVFYNQISHLGATMHYLSNQIDGGNIIYQEKVNLTDDIDQGLVYYLSFLMEGIVFRKGWDILRNNNFSFIGTSQDIKTGSYFNRSTDLMTIDFCEMNTAEIVKRIKSFGVLNQGCEILNFKNTNMYKIFDAQVVVNPFLLNFYELSEAGEILLRYDDKYLIKTIDGILKIIRYE